MRRYACGFIAKAEVQDIPLIGLIPTLINCIYVNRSDAKNRNLVLEKIDERQREYLKNSKNMNPLVVFPEGTVTNGKYILKFKKGAFNALLPIKPFVIKQSFAPLDVSIGACGTLPCFVRILCYLYHNITVYELPIIRPTDQMKHNFDKDTEEWEMFSEVTRNIMCEIADLRKSDKTFRDSQAYKKIVMYNKYNEKIKSNDVSMISQTSKTPLGNSSKHV